jgi:phage I-like protein
VAFVLRLLDTTIKRRSFGLVPSRTTLLSQTVAVALDGDGVERDGAGLPTAIRLFRAGVNETAKGTFVFDAEARESTLSAAEEWGVEFMVDLEHQSIDRDAPNWDPDARAWLNLEVRNGELWAVNLRWNPDGVRRLTEKTQRYVSPTFRHDAEGRVREIVNIALCAMPATYGAPALVAASRTHRSARMTLKERLALTAALTVRLSAGKAAIVKLAEGEEGEPAAETGKFEAVQAAGKKAIDALAALDGVKGVDEAHAAVADAKAAVSEFEAAVAAMTGSEPAAEPAAEPEAAAVEPTKEDEEKAVTVAATRLVRLSGKASIVEAVAEVETWRASHLALETERQKLATERLTLESAERRAGCASLVKLGGLAPAAVWADEKADKPASYLAAMAIGDFRAFVAASTKGRKADPKAPPSGDAVTTLSARELAMCAEMKIDPKQYAANKPTRKA